MQQEKYTLTWHSYSDHLRKTLNNMMTSSEFADVTLVTDDKQQIKAHRNILSACSPVFKNILQLDSNIANPVIYLRGIQHSEMESILQFIYLGEARFYKERINEFIMVCKDLEIMELSTGRNMNFETPPNEESIEHENEFTNDEDIVEDTAQTFNDDAANVEHKIQTSTKSSKPIIENNEANRGVGKTEDGKYACNQCDKKYASQGNLSTHVQSHHKGIKNPCNQCGKQYSCQANLFRHIRSQHVM